LAIIDNLVSYWKLDETSGDRSDAHGSNTLTDHNGTSYGTGKIGNCADFELNNSNFLTKSDNSDLSVGDIDFSISLWIKFESLTFSDYYAVCKGNEYQIYYDYISSRIKFRANISGGATISANNLGAPSTGTWYHIVCWHDSVNNEVGIVINNGTPDTTSYSSGFTDGTGTFAIGAYEWFSGFYTGYFDGLIDEVGFWKKVLSSSEISSLYNSGNGLAYPLSTDTPVNKSIQCIWNTLIKANQVRQSIWNTLACVNKTEQSVWNTLACVNKTEQSIWNTNSLVNQNKQLIWDISSLVNRQNQYIWDISAYVNKTNQLIWDISSLVNRQNQYIWDISAYVNKTNQLIWDISSLVNRQNQYIWDISAYVNKTNQLIWDISSLVNRQNQYIWDISAYVNKTNQLIWGANSLVNQNKQLIWNINKLISNNKTLIWNTEKVRIKRIVNLICYLNKNYNNSLYINKINNLK